MAVLTPEQLKRLMDSGLSMPEIRTIASKRGDTVPGGTLLGELARPVVGAALRFGQAAGATIGGLTGATEEQLSSAADKSAVLQAPFLGTLAFESQKSLLTKRGKEQLTGQGAEALGTFFPVGRVASKLTPVLGRTLGTATSLGLSGYGVEAGYKLQQGEKDALAPGLGTAIPAAIPVVGKLLSVTPSILRGTFAKTTGLAPETVQTVLTRPKEFESAMKTGLDRLTLGNLIETRFTELEKKMSSLGEGYDTIRSLPNRVQFTENPVKKVLGQYKISLQNGRLNLSPESPALSSRDISAVERFYGQYGTTNNLSPNGVLNARQGLDELANWAQEPGRTQLSEDIARAIRAEYDKAGKVQIPGLSKLDNEFSPVIKEVKDLRKEYLQFKDGEWGLKDTALSRLANATNKGREKVLERLEKFVPGISQQIQIVRALEDITAASGQKVGAYLPSILAGGAAFAASAGNPILAALALVTTLPQVTIPMLIAFGKANGIASDIIRTMVGKIAAGKTFSEEELLIFKNAVLNHLNQVSPGDQFLASGLGKRTLAYAQRVRPGLTARDINRDPFPEDALLPKGNKDSFKGFQDLSKEIEIGSTPTNTLTQKQIDTVNSLSPQQVNSYLDFKNKAKQAYPEFESLYNKIAEGLDLPKTDYGPSIKGDPRAIEKAVDDYGGDFTKIKDMLRGQFVVGSTDQLKQLVSRLSSLIPAGSKYKNNILTPMSTGYRDVKVNVPMSNGITAEFQIMFPEMETTKFKLHPEYERVRPLDSKKDRGERLTQEEKKTVADANSKMTEAYTETWNQVVSKYKIPNDIGGQLEGILQGIGD